MRRWLKLSVFLALCLVRVNSASAQGGFAQGIAWRYTPAGAFPAGGATITVCTSSATGTPCTPTVSVYSDPALTLPVTNPLPQCTLSPQIGCMDNLGNFSFYATVGVYSYTITGSGLTSTGPIVINAVNSQGTGTIITTLTDAGFDACLTAAGANGTCIIPANTSVPVTSSHSVSTAYTVLRCERGAILNYGASGRIRLLGVGDSIKDCFMQGPGTGVTKTGQVITMETDYQDVDGIVMTAFGSTSSNGELAAIGGNGGRIANIRAYNNADLDVFINNGTGASTMSDWRFENNYVGEFIVHATAATSSILHVVSVGNTYRNGQNSKVEYCEEYGPFGGTAVSDVTSSGNTCTATASGTNGGYSFASVTGCNMVGDTWNSNGFTYTIGAVEIVTTTRCTATGNTANNGTGGDGFICDRCTFSTFTGNTVNGFAIGTTHFGFHNVVSAVTSPNSTDNVYSGNTINFPTSGTGRGIWDQCNAAGAVCKGNKFIGNSIFSDGTASSFGIFLENDAGSMTNESILLNDTIGPQTGFQINDATATPNIHYLEGINTATTTLYNDVNGAVVPTPFRGSTQVFGSASGSITHAAPTAAGSNTITDPAATGTTSLAVAEACGATSGASQPCAKTVQTLPIIIFGDVTLNTATTQSITTLPFSGAANYSCAGSDLTNAAGIVSFNTYATASVTIQESGGANTDHLRYTCVGF